MRKRKYSFIKWALSLSIYGLIVLACYLQKIPSLQSFIFLDLPKFDFILIDSTVTGILLILTPVVELSLKHISAYGADINYLLSLFL